MADKIMVRQGDVLLESIDNIPKNARVTQRGRVVLALGEETGHSHEMEGEVEASKTDDIPAEDMYIEIKEPTVLTHQEHGEIELPPGKYRMRKQTEYVETAASKPQRRPVAD